MGRYLNFRQAVIFKCYSCGCCFQVLSERVVCEVRALVVLPTKELCQQVSLNHGTIHFIYKERELIFLSCFFFMQVYKVFTTYAEGTPLKVVMVAGQKSFAAEQASLSELRSVQFAYNDKVSKNMKIPECS